ncbi:transcription factor RelB [Tachyglossus aculeatus]|uniref:transcription factor RelB n=1 Tax=Tachyglossus aculeatus TaxID=9261 RepID=UPI0018F2F0D3|nr:transcription factor RelB [Tachyglossus aculeatus]
MRSRRGARPPAADLPPLGEGGQGAGEPSRPGTPAPRDPGREGGGDPGGEERGSGRGRASQDSEVRGAGQPPGDRERDGSGVRSVPIAPSSSEKAAPLIPPALPPGAVDLPGLALSSSRSTEELEIIDEYIKENGFRPESGGGEGPGPRLVSRGPSPASLSTVTLGGGDPLPPPGPPAPPAAAWAGAPGPLEQLLQPSPVPAPAPAPLPPQPRLRPRLVITEQPKQRGMRFRYECEGRSAGSILGETSSEASKTLPAIELRHCEGLREVDVVACLVWKDWPHRVHPHGLVGKDCADGVCRVRLRPHVCPRHSFNNLGIQCVRKREIEAAIERKIQLGIDPFSAGSLRNHQEVDMNVVRICFQASYRDPQGQPRRLEPVLSEPVYDKKSTNTSELRICRLNKDSGPCTGGEELYLLCDKVQKEDISVVFSTDSWEGRADFSQADVHRQIAIVLKTPPYEDLEIPAPVRVRVFLQRLTDGVCSDPLPFTYLPRDHDSYGVDKKRKRGVPDVMGELNSSDPHGIESKRRQRKPATLAPPGHTSAAPFFPLPGLAEPGFVPAVTLPGLEPPAGPDSLDDYGFLFAHCGGGAGGGGVGVGGFEPVPAGVPGPLSLPLPGLDLLQDAAPAPGHELMHLLDTFPLAGPPGEGTASLVGSNMFPNQYRDGGSGGGGGFALGLLQPGPEPT